MPVDVADHLRRALTLLCALLLLALIAAASARAGTVAITVGADPVESIATQLGATGTADNDSQYVVEHYKPTGGTACGANPDADDGRGSGVDTNYIAAAGPYARQANVTFGTAGSYLVCAWLMQHTNNPGPNPVVTTDSRTIAVRVPHLSLTLGVPASVTSDQAFQATATTQVEAERNLYVYAIPDTGRGCAANAAAASSTDRVRSVFVGDDLVGGPATVTDNLSLSTAGAWLLCGYISYRYNGNDTPELTAQASFTVVAPPPPCVVPAVVKDEPLAQTKARILTAACTVGRVHYLASARYARGSVFRIAPAAGTSLANAAGIDVWVSSGAPCLVPAVPRSRTLTAVKRRLVASGCAVGLVTHRRSRSVRRGRVIGLGRPRGTRLSPRTAVSIVVSSGRR